MGENNRKTELLVGLFLTVGLLLLGALILQFSRFKESFRETYDLTVTFPSAAGINEGSPIKLGGINVGRVSEAPQPNPEFTAVIIPLSIFDTYKIPAGSVFKVGTDGLMGDAMISISPPEAGTTAGFLEKGALVDGTKAGGLGALEDAAEELTTKTHAVLEDVQGAIKTLNNTIASLDDGFLGEDNAEQFNGTLTKLNAAIGKLDADVLGPSNTENLTAAINDIREAAASIRAASDKLPPVIEKGDAVMEKGAKAMDDLGETARSLQATAGEATALLREVRNGDGLASALLGDPVLREDFRALIANLRSRGVLRYRDESDQGVDTVESDSRGNPTGRNLFPWQR